MKMELSKLKLLDTSISAGNSMCNGIYKKRLEFFFLFFELRSGVTVTIKYGLAIGTMMSEFANMKKIKIYPTFCLDQLKIF